jgi:hypothetical protein
VKLAGVAVTAVLGLAVPVSAGEIAVPRGVPVVVDGVLEPEVWADALVDRTVAGLEVRLQHDGHDLYLAVASDRPGFASLCVAPGAERPSTIDVLHASAALGQVRYERRRDAWTSRAREFVYALRNPARTELARAERRRYLEEHGWVASTWAMGRVAGGGSVQELHFAGERWGEAVALAIAFRLEDGAIRRWPASLAEADGCADPALVSGEVPERLAFAPETWARLRLGTGAAP